MTRILIAEDQEMVRGALISLLELEDDLEVVAQVGRGDEVLEAARASAPDVALLDIEMPGISGLEALEQLAAGLPAVKILILTTFGRPGYLRRAMEGGAAGFVLKDAPASELACAIRRGRPVAPSPASGSSTRAWPPRRCRRASRRSPPVSTRYSPPVATTRPSRSSRTRCSCRTAPCVIICHR
jgi:DNA-binding NarL/FixJ family response regulator